MKGDIILAESPDLKEFDARHAWVKDIVHIESNIAVLGSYGDIVVLVSGYLRICHCRHNMSKGLGPPPPRGPWLAMREAATCGQWTPRWGERDRNMRRAGLSAAAHGSLRVSPSRVLTAKTGRLTLHCITRLSSTWRTSAIFIPCKVWSKTAVPDLCPYIKVMHRANYLSFSPQFCNCKNFHIHLRTAEIVGKESWASEAGYNDSQKLE